MNTRATVLRESRHSEFLDARRQDPITRKIFSAGDRVTRCAACLLPFLQESWEANGRTHCGQFASVALDKLEPQPDDKDLNETSEAEETQVKVNPLELVPIPIALREVPIILK